jgi:hypothetical protein
MQMEQYKLQVDRLEELSRRVIKTGDVPPHPVIAGPRSAADFVHSFSFAPVPWPLTRSFYANTLRTSVAMSVAARSEPPRFSEGLMTTACL